MNNLNLILGAAILSMMAASCVNEIGSDHEVAAMYRYNLTFENQTKTDLSGSGSKRSVSWTEGDQIKYYTESRQSNPVNTTVNLDGSGAYISIPRGRTDEFVNAVYGAAQLKSNTSTDHVMYISSPIKGDQRHTSFDEAHVCAAFSSDIESPEIRFHNAACIVHFVSAADVYKVVFSGNNDEIINAGNNGDLKITSESSWNLTVEPASSGGTSISIVTNGEGSDFYFAMLPVYFSDGIKVDCYNSLGELFVTMRTNSVLNTVSGSGAVKMLDLGNAQDWVNAAPPVAIDLGLSVKWASYNVGATKPEDYGDFFAWGEVSSKSDFMWANYQFGTGKNGPFSKYVLDENYGTIDHKTILDLTDDAAATVWIGDWRLPSKDEVSELMSTCTWTWTKWNGVNGYRVTGPNGKSIFLPANGMRSGTSISDEGTVGNYWSSSISEDGSYFALSPYFSQSGKEIGNCYRYFGLGIRPVYGKVVPVLEITIPEALILTMGKTESSVLTANILPENATYKNLTWSSTDESVATVDHEGKVTAVAVGNVSITAFSADGSKSAQCRVDVNQPIQSITFDKSTIETFVGADPIALTATVLPEEYTYKVLDWKSSRGSVATVDENGYVTALSTGTATITATARDGSGKKASCTVKVYADGVESISLDKTELTIYKGNSSALTVTVLPSTANQAVLWTSSDESVVTVSQYGQVTAVHVGTAEITATTADGSMCAACAVTVNQYVTSLTLDQTTMEMTVGDDPVTLVATVLPSEFTDKRLTWTSSNPSVAKVDSHGVVTAVSSGTASITARTLDGSSLSASCKVIVNCLVESVSLDKTTLKLYRGRTSTLTATIIPADATDKSVTWTSIDESVATVDQSGMVTAVGLGTTTIMVKTVDGGYMASCSVEVIAKPSQWIDLGLSVLWASVNIGANYPDEYGDYFAWAETEPKSIYASGNYKWGTGESDWSRCRMTKYNDKYCYSGTLDNCDTMLAWDNAAYTKWGSDCGIPNHDQCEELINNCTWTWTNNYNETGISGMIVTGKGAYSNQSIFLPAAGAKGVSGDPGKNAGFWSTSLSRKSYDSKKSAYAIRFDKEDGPSIRLVARYAGLTIRPIRK